MALPYADVSDGSGVGVIAIDLARAMRNADLNPFVTDRYGRPAGGGAVQVHLSVGDAERLTEILREVKR